MTAYPQELKEKILQRLKANDSVQVLSQRYGVARATIYEWKADVLRAKKFGYDVMVEASAPQEAAAAESPPAKESTLKVLVEVVALLVKLEPSESVKVFRALSILLEGK